MDKPIEFEGVIESSGRGGACVPVPLDGKRLFGGGRSIRVEATYDGFAARSNVVSMGGRFVLGIHKATRQAIGKGPGDSVLITLVEDRAPRSVEIPPELAQQFTKNPDIKALFDTLAYTYRKEFARWVSEAKRQETRDRRAVEALEKVRTGQTL